MNASSQAYDRDWYAHGWVLKLIWLQVLLVMEIFAFAIVMVYFGNRTAVESIFQNMTYWPGVSMASLFLYTLTCLHLSDFFGLKQSGRLFATLT
jgi:hypothetical protein